jgi:hypothetical protein
MKDVARAGRVDGFDQPDFDFEVAAMMEGEDASWATGDRWVGNTLRSEPLQSGFRIG